MGHSNELVEDREGRAGKGSWGSCVVERTADGVYIDKCRNVSAWKNEHRMK